MIYTSGRGVDNCTVSITVNVTVTITVNITVTITITVRLTLNNEKGKCLDSNLCLNRFLKWEMTCEASVGVSVKTVICFYSTTFIARVTE